MDGSFVAYSRQRWANGAVYGRTDGPPDRQTDGRTDGRTDGWTDGGRAVATIEQWDYVKRGLDDWKAGWRDGLNYLIVHDNFFTGRGNMAFSFDVKSRVVVQTVGLMEALANCLVEDLLDENGPDEASWVYEKAWLLNEMDRLMASIRSSLKGRGYYTCNLKIVAATERKLEESCDRYYRRFAATNMLGSKGISSAKITDKLNFCQEQYRIWKGLVHHYNPLWWATDGFISSLNDLPLRSLEDILLFTGTVGQARIRRVCRRWGTIIRMSYISKCLNVQVPDIWTTVSSWKIRMLSKGLSVMVTEHTHAIAFIRPSVHPSVRPSVRPPVRPSTRPSVHPSVRPPVRSSTRPFVHPSVRPSDSVEVTNAHDISVCCGNRKKLQRNLEVLEGADASGELSSFHSKPSGFRLARVWVHVDVASPVHAGERATGFGVALLAGLCASYSESLLLRGFPEIAVIADKFSMVSTPDFSGPLTRKPGINDAIRPPLQ
ncbi:hypothetical protein BV898_05701 [Hypsibius exemplaris]|uniref:F-box domain-containing protein n=1 Tax=Hypsibius exemplaris TaxID=2072580 RepID=A0A1W0WZ24_HYPEX|nr:hypothetical protein BV898_05701 [Hypsibius exemplaris]